jgi:hypothetical protein
VSIHVPLGLSTAPLVKSGTYEVSKAGKQKGDAIRAK